MFSNKSSKPKMGQLIMARLNDLMGQHDCLANARGRGLMIGFDVLAADGQANPTLRDAIIQAAFQRGLLLLGCGETSIRITPPLCVDEATVDQAFVVMGEAVGACA